MIFWEPFKAVGNGNQFEYFFIALASLESKVLIFLLFMDFKKLVRMTPEQGDKHPVGILVFATQLSWVELQSGT